MGKGRLEAFSDGVIAIIITIMVLELVAPHEASLQALVDRTPILLSYILSFIYVGIYWNNHHHLFQVVRHVTGGVLWANLHLLFWLSLVPFGTAWMGETHFAATPVGVYGFVMLMAAVAYFLLTRALLSCHGRESQLAAALGADRKGKISVGFYVAALVVARWSALAACAIYVVVAIIWLVPDRRMERILAAKP